MQTWYDSLAKPPLTPPKKVFGPVWGALYLLIFTSLAIYFSTPLKPHFALTCILLLVHFTAGFSWTSIFFGRKRILWALADIVVLDLTLIAVITLFLKASTTAALLLLPYLGWGLFATYLNLGIYRLNRNTPEADT
ncbi:TspO/MBR family protein [Chlorobium sp. N1]|uniref:TspO/MBR family protein n=1 Tax=Chlorobium sp. N1 TaxID=2491138 RepID=UPI00103B223A|nr:TspO/MBR family protein [Chlorobium sp. N1]TCD47345.1 tryptophan-rich sensory protein [Chlorobium sp. N1]